MENYKTLFDDQGYIAISGFFDTAEISELQQKTASFLEKVAPSLDEDIVYYEDKNDASSIKQVQKLYEFDDYYNKIANSNKVVALAEELLGGPVTLQNMQYFNKIPKTGKATPAHQDGYYFRIIPQQAITMWLSLGDADADNGAVCYIPHSHKKELRPHGATTTLGFSQGISNWSHSDDSSEIQMQASAGDILVHHCLTIHRANANTSDRQRKSIGLIFYRADVEIDTNANQAYQRALNERLKTQGKI